MLPSINKSVKEPVQNSLIKEPVKKPSKQLAMRMGFYIFLSIILLSIMVNLACEAEGGGGSGSSSNSPSNMGYNGVLQLLYSQYDLEFDTSEKILLKDASNNNTQSSGVVLSPDGKYVYLSERGPNGDASADGSVVVFSRNIDTGALQLVQRYQHDSSTNINLLSADTGAISPDGKNLYVPGRTGNNFMVFGIDPSDGTLTPVESVSGNGLKTVYSIAVTPDGKQVLVTSHAATYMYSHIFVYNRDSSTGELTYKTLVTVEKRPTQIVINSKGNHIYVAGWGDGAMASGYVGFMVRNPSTGNIYLIKTYKQGDTSGANTISGIAFATSLSLSPDEKTLYVGSQGTSTTPIQKPGIAIFSRNPTNGDISFVKAYEKDSPIKNKTGQEVILNGLVDIADIAISAGANKVYVSSQSTNTVFVFDRDTHTGDLVYNTNFKDDTNLKNVFGLAVAPDGQYIYVGVMGDATNVGGIATLKYKKKLSM